MYGSEVKIYRLRDRPKVIWTNRVEDYLNERRISEYKTMESNDRDIWSIFRKGFTIYGRKGLRVNQREIDSHSPFI